MHYGGQMTMLDLANFALVGTALFAPAVMGVFSIIYGALGGARDSEGDPVYPQCLSETVGSITMPGWHLATGIANTAVFGIAFIVSYMILPCMEPDTDDETAKQQRFQKRSVWASIIGLFVLCWLLITWSIFIVLFHVNEGVCVNGDSAREPMQILALADIVVYSVVILSILIKAMPIDHMRGKIPEPESYRVYDRKIQAPFAAAKQEVKVANIQALQQMLQKGKSLN